MTKKKTLDASLVDTINGYGIIRCKEKTIDQDGNLCGHTEVWYDICMDEGEGDIIESFKTITKARNFARKG